MVSCRNVPRLWSASRKSWLKSRNPFHDAYSCINRVQRQRQLHKNTFVTPNQRVGFGQMTESQKDRLNALVTDMFTLKNCRLTTFDFHRISNLRRRHRHHLQWTGIRLLRPLQPFRRQMAIRRSPKRQCSEVALWLPHF